MARSLLWVVLLAVPAVAVTVRVKPTPGGPQIHVDDQPIPPRFFWGSMGGGAVRIGGEWTEHAFEFRPVVDATNAGTLHFRLGQNPGTVELAEVKLVDTATGADVLPAGSFATADGFTKAWNTWPMGEQNTVAAFGIEGGVLRVNLTAPKSGSWPDFHFHSKMVSFSAGHTYRCTFRAKAEPSRTIKPDVYHVANGAWTNIGGPPGPFLSQVGLARDAGVRLVSFSAPACWSPPEQATDWQPLDAFCRRIIEVHPTVLLVPRVGANAPDWWLARHPSARMVYDGDQPNRVACVSDRQYRADAAAHLEKLTRHLCEAFPEHFAGIHPCGQNTGEWFYYDTWRRPLSGYDPATLAAYRQWLTERGLPGEAATVPTAEERRAHPRGLLRDPAAERLLIEFARFQQAEMADHVLALAAACRRGSDGGKLVVFFYGYHYEFAPVQTGAPTSGHYALERVLPSRDIDILCSPISYTDRGWPGTAPCMTSAESVKQAGILWLNEDDTRTHLDLRPAATVQEGNKVDAAQACQLMLRNTAQAALRGFGTWWMDLPGLGWFNDSVLWREQVRLNPVDQALLKRARPFTPDIAAIIGEDSMCHLTGGSAVAARPLIYEARAALGRSGAPYGQYTLTDALTGKVPARLQVYLAAWSLNPEQRAAVKAGRRAETVRTWCWAPGYLRLDGTDADGIEEVTGFRARPVNLPTAEVTVTGAGRAAGLTQGWGPKDAITPLFAVDATEAETWATWSDGSPAVAVRRTATGTDAFVGVPQLTSELVRALARVAGVHLYAQIDLAVWAAEGLLSLHALSGGPVELDTGWEGPVVDALDGSPLGQGPRLTLKLAKGETRVLRFR